MSIVLAVAPWTGLPLTPTLSSEGRGRGLSLSLCQAPGDVMLAEVGAGHLPLPSEERVGVRGAAPC